MRVTAAQRLLAAILAIWMPLSCCCQAMALARTAVAAVTSPDEAAPCTAKARCCSEPEAATAVEANADRDRTPPPCDQCPACAAAKGKAPPPTSPSIDHDDVGREVAWAPAVDECAEAHAVRADACTWSGADPPWRPAGRTALARHARLLI